MNGRRPHDDPPHDEPLPPGEPPAAGDATHARAREIGGFDGPEPTRYGDWEHNGRCTDF